MIPKKLFISNFMILSSLEIDFDQFSSAIVIARINGDARKSNGGGKSTVSHALNYVLFDFLPVSPIEKTIREDQEQMSVSLEFETENSELYRITRSRRRKSRQAEIKLEKFESDTWKDKSQKTNSETEKEIQKLLGFNLEIVRNTNFFAQSDLSGLFSAKTLSTRKSIFEDIFQLHIYSILEKNLYQKKIKELEKEILKLERDSLHLKNPENAIQELQNNISSFEEKKLDIENKIAKQENLISDLQIKIGEQKFSISSHEEDKFQLLKEKNKEKQELQNKIKIVESLLCEKNKSLSLFKSQLEEKKSEECICAERLDLEKRKKLRFSNDVKPEAEKAQKNEIIGRNFVARLEADVKQREKQNLPENENCPECEQKISFDYRVKHKEEKNQKLQEMKASLEDYRIKLSAISAKKMNLEDEWQKSVIWENQLRVLEEKLIAKKKEISSLQENEKQQAQFILHLEEEINLKKEIVSDIELTIIKIQNEIDIASLQNQQSVVSSLEEKLKTEKENKQKLSYLLSEETKNLAVAQNYLQIEKQNSEKKKKIDQNLLSKKEELEISYLVQSAFKDSIPRFIINENRVMLQEQVNLWLQKLKPEAQITIHPENFEIEFKLENKLRNYDQLSFGQKFIIFVAFKLGMQSLLKKKFNFQCRLLQFDEVDQSFDENSTQIYLQLIKELQKYFKIIVIAHNDNLKNSFSHSIVLDSNGIDYTSGELTSN